MSAVLPQFAAPDAAVTVLFVSIPMNEQRTHAKFTAKRPHSCVFLILEPVVGFLGSVSYRKREVSIPAPRRELQMHEGRRSGQQALGILTSCPIPR